MDRARWDQYASWGILGLVLAILLFALLATGAVRPIDFVVVEGLAALGLVLWCVKLAGKRGVHVIWAPLSWVVLAWVAWVMLGYSRAEIEYVARQELLRTLAYAAVFFLIVNNLNRQRVLHIVPLVLVAVAVLISFYAVFQFATDSDKIWHFQKPAQYGRRAGGTFINPNHLAAFLEMVLPLALSYTVLGRFGAVTRVLLAYATLAILAGIGVTLSRAGIFTTGVVLIVFFVIVMFRRGFRLLSLAMLLLVVGAGAIYNAKAYQFKKRLDEIRERGLEREVRPMIWQAAVRLWVDHPWQGGGPGHFDYRFPQHRPNKLQNRPLYAHNDYLNTLADYGVIGLTILLTGLGLVFWGVRRAWRFAQRGSDTLEVRSSNRFALLVGGALGIVAILIHSFFDFNLQIPAIALVATALAATLTVQLRFATDAFWIGLRLGTRAALAGAGLLTAAYLASQAARSAREQSCLLQADATERQLRNALLELPKVARGTAEHDALLRQASELPPRLIQQLQSAAAIEDANFQTFYRIGEQFRLESWKGDQRTLPLAAEAMSWFARAMAANPLDPYSPLRYGMCLDWIGRTAEGALYFEKARQLDPNNYYVLAHVGWHHVQREEYAEALAFFEQSIRLEWMRNPIASRYRQIVRRKLAELEKAASKGTNQPANLKSPVPGPSQGPK